MSGGEPREGAIDRELRAELLQQAVEVLQAGIFVYTLEGKLVDVNETACRLHGWSREEMLQLSPAEFIDASTYHVFDEFRHAIARGEEFRGLARGRRADGSTFDAAVHGVPVEAGGRVYAFGSVRDVTAEQRMREKVAHSQRMEALGRLASSIAHDFNNLLTVIRLNAEVAHAENDIARVRERLQDLEDATARAETITSQLLSFSRSRPLQVEQLSVSEVTESLAPILDRLLPEDIALELDLPKAIPAVAGSRRAVEQILLNLVVNARDAMPAGGTITVTARSTDDDADVTLEVRDEGVGMDQETLARCCEPFFSTKAAQGTGLGLATVAGAVEQLSAKLAIESEPGHGTRVRITMPASTVGALAVDEGTRELAPAAARPLDGRTLLIVDDDALLRRSLCAGLRRYGAEALEAGPLEAEARLAEAPVDLVVCDVFMPEITGPELVARLHASRPELPVLYTSGFVGSDVGDLRTLAKPFSLRQLVGAILDL